jgi:hypothetical protein
MTTWGFDLFSVIYARLHEGGIKSQFVVFCVLFILSRNIHLFCFVIVLLYLLNVCYC